MAKGGSGDVLTGLLTGLLASGYPPEDSCRLGVWLHGCAGDLAAIDLSSVAMNASDLISFLPQAWKSILERG
jgi:NAD(P)H-hydrate repair Nnr-like enzyme with NAD(P)H-hydrate dehydratase domain